MKINHKLWLGVIVLIILSPLGLLLPRYFKAGGAWGEGSAGEVKNQVGYVPQGMAKSTTIWNPPMPDYSFKGWGNKGLSHLSFAYIASAIVGIAIIILAIHLLGKILSRKSH